MNLQQDASAPTIAAVIASTHHPFYYRASTAAGADRPPFADEWVEKIMRFRETLTRARPDVLVMVGSDHFHQLWLDNMPQFLVGKAPFFDANFYNEEREFGLPRMTLRGQEEASPTRCANRRISSPSFSQAWALGCGRNAPSGERRPAASRTSPVRASSATR